MMVVPSFGCSFDTAVRGGEHSVDLLCPLDQNLILKTRVHTFSLMRFTNPLFSFLSLYLNLEMHIQFHCLLVKIYVPEV